MRRQVGLRILQRRPVEHLEIRPMLAAQGPLTLGRRVTRFGSVDMQVLDGSDQLGDARVLRESGVEFDRWRVQRGKRRRGATLMRRISAPPG